MTPAAATAGGTRPSGSVVARHAVWPAVALAVYVLAHVLVIALPALHDHAPTFCVFRAVTGVPCPTCGSTRATLALASGQLNLAFRYNPLISAAWLILPVALLGARVLKARSRSISVATRRWAVRGAVLVLAVAGLANWIYVLGNLREVEHSNGHGTSRTAADLRSPRGAGEEGL